MSLYATGAPRRAARGLRHPEYAMQQLARSRSTRFQVGFARMTMYLLPQVKDVDLEPCEEGLRILAGSETALASAQELIRQIHGEDVEFGEPNVGRMSHTV
jgi:hypothetical protein